MSGPLNVLIVEDSEEDALLLVRELRRSGYAPSYKRVDTAPAMTAALEGATWDVVVSDYGMPQFDGREALSLVRKRGLDVPFVIVSGAIGEDTAVEAMRAGANDYILKSNRARLVPVIERELREARMRAEQRRMENQLALSDRLASIGTLAAGVAHEINNPLATIIINLEYIASEIAGWASGATVTSNRQMFRTISGPLHDARLSADRVRLIVRDLKTFSRADDDTKHTVDLIDVIESTARMAASEITQRARLVKDFVEVPPIAGNEARIGQVVLNLLLNAAQAIADGHPESNEIRVATRVLGREHVVIEVADTGIGIPKEIIGRIFDPFFTTKPVGVGTGLGLSITHRIVCSMGGEIAVEARPEGGTIFRVTLPVETSAEMRPLEPILAQEGSTAHILVIDDEEMLLDAIQRILVPHQVVTASTADRALDLLGNGQRYDLVLCDLMMPGKTGMDLHRELQATMPEVADRMVFTTGGAFTTEARAFLAGVKNERIEKPLSIESLRKLIANRLREGARRA